MTAHDLKPGSRVSEYVLEERLGRGGFGDVWRARHHVWKDRVVAIKVPADPERARILKNEGAIQEAVKHENVVEVLGFDPDHDPPYLVMEFVDGESLRAPLARSGRLPVETALLLARDILAGLGAAHARGIVHRDLKPENVLLPRGGRAKLTDFGLGRLREADRQRLELSGGLGGDESGPLEGTLAYMAPEQREAGRPIDARADVYAFGIVLFEMLTGTRPEGGEAPGDLVAGLDPRLDDLFRGCYCRLEKRFPDARATALALEPILAGRLAPSGVPVAQLEPLGAGSPWARIPLGPGPLTLGSARDADLRVELPGVAPHQATIQHREGAFWIRDGSGRTGTYLLPATLPAGVREEDHCQKVGAAWQRLAEGVVIWIGRPMRREPSELATQRLFRFHDGAPATGARAEAATADGPLEPVVRMLAAFAAIGLMAFAAIGLVEERFALAAVLGGCALFALRRASPAPDVTAIMATPADPQALVGRPAGVIARTIAVALDVALFAFVLRRPWFPGAWVAYDWLATGIFGATAGKWLVGLEVLGTDGAPIGLARALLRTVSKFISALPLGLGFLLAGITVSKQALHDFFADSRVIWKSSLPD
jgi:uncharacterized RDD family membrane protein YckC